jgi:hypothetical protein
MECNFIGVDVGRKGGIALISSTGLSLWPMVVEQQRGLDLTALTAIVLQCGMPSSLPARVGIEHNTARPGEVPDYAYKFGLQEGQLHGMFYAHGFYIDLLSPQTWLDKMGLPGKVWDQGCKQRLEILYRHFPNAQVVGPRGGIMDGLVEAALIAIYMRELYSTPLGKKTGPRKAKFRGLEP